MDVWVFVEIKEEQHLGWRIGGIGMCHVGD